MKEINVGKLDIELRSLEIEISGCNSNGIVWDMEGNEIQDLPEVDAVIAAHDPSDVPASEPSLQDQVCQLRDQIAQLQSTSAIVVEKMTTAEILTVDDVASISANASYVGKVAIDG